MSSPVPAPDDEALYEQWVALLDQADEIDPLSAQALYRQCEALARQTSDPDELLAQTWRHRALAYYEAAMVKEGDHMLRDAAQLVQRLYQDSPRAFVIFLTMMTNDCLKYQRPHVAAEWTEAMVQQARPMSVEYPRLLFDAIYTHTSIIHACHLNTSHPQVDALLEEALALFPRIPDIDPSIRTVLEFNQAQHDLAQGRYRKARVALERLLPSIRRDVSYLEVHCLESLVACARVPHMRGDEPLEPGIRVSHAACSPHAWG